MTKSTQSSAGKAPSHIAYQVREQRSGKGVFTRIGAAWPHKDGLGFNLQIDAVPLDGRITLRVLTEQPQE